MQRVVPALIQNGRYQHAYLGISGSTYSKSWAQALGLPANAKGAYVSQVLPGSPAGQAGLQGGNQNTSIAVGADQNGVVYLQSGGDLITTIDGHTVNSMDDLMIYLAEHTSPGQKVTLTVLHPQGQQANVTVTLGTQPSQRAQQASYLGNGQSPFGNSSPFGDGQCLSATARRSAAIDTCRLAVKPPCA